MLYSILIAQSSFLVIVVVMLAFMIGIYLLIDKYIFKGKEDLLFALESAQFGVWSIDLKTNKVSASPRMLELWGVNAKDFNQDRSILQAKVHPDDIAGMRQALNKSIASDSIYELRYRIRPHKNFERWILSRGRCVYDFAGNPRYFAGVVSEFTDQKLIEEQNKVLFELSGSGAVEINPETLLFTRVNSRFTELTGFTENELLYMTLTDLIPKEDVRDHLEKYKSYLSVPDKKWSVEFRITNKTGNEIWLQCNGYVQRNSSGVPTNILNTYFDITDLKRIQSELQSVISPMDNFRPRRQIDL